MNTDIRIAVSFKGHRKRKRLELLLGPKAVLALIDLWISTAMNHPEGKLSGMDELDVSLEAAWEGDEKAFVKALVDVGFLDRGEDGTFELHDWHEHQPYVVHARERSERARKAARVRWEKNSECTESANSLQDASIKHTDCIAPSPAPVPAPSPSPYPSPMERDKANKSAKATPPYEEVKNL